MQIDKKELLEGLVTVRPGLAKSDIIEQSTHFIFTGNDVVTYNDRVCVLFPFKTDFTCSAKAEELYKILSSISEDSVEIKVDGKQMKFISKGTKAGLTVSFDQKLVDVVKSLDVDNLDWFDLPSDFIKGIKMCIFSASRDVSQGYLACIGILKDRVVSSDNIRLSRYVLDGSISEDVLIPSSCAEDLCRFDVSRYALTDSWIHFEDENGVVFSVRRVIDTYPDIDDYFDVSGGVELNIPSQVKDVIESMLIMVEGQSLVDKTISITVENNEMVLSSEKIIGWIEKHVNINYTGEKLSFLVNPILFMQILEKLTKMTVLDGRAFLTSGSFSHIMALPV